MSCGNKTAIGFEQSEAYPCVFRKFDDEEVEMVVVVHVDSTLAHTQATIKRLAAELEGKFKVMSMVEKFNVEKASRTSASSGMLTLLKWMSHKPRGRKNII